jgi:3-methyladenine DNA glycosylase/8-oxoguanine DNA glycosylase
VTVIRVPLVGAGGEPVDFWRTVVSHGLVFLPPTSVDETGRTLEAAVRTAQGVRLLRIRQVDGEAEVRLAGNSNAQLRAEVRETTRHLLRLDEDLSAFYEIAHADAELHWAGIGAARLVRSPSVFEEVIKTVCTTNCTWSATVRMVSMLVDGLGDPTPPGDGATRRRAFPTPAAMADAPESFYKDEVRSGYRAPFMREIARRVASGEVDLEALAASDLSDDDLERELLALPGVGKYAAAHIMLLLGRYSRLVLDSWTRPKYVSLVGRAKTDRQIAWRFRRFGRFAGLAFWLYVTQDWVQEPTAIR